MKTKYEEIMGWVLFVFLGIPVITITLFFLYYTFFRVLTWVF